MKKHALQIVQYVLFALIILTGQIIPKKLPFLFIFLVGIAVVVIAITAKNAKKKNIFYSVIGTIQHPYYTALLLTTLSLVLDLYTYERLVMWIAFFVVVVMRLQQQENKSKKRKSIKQAAYRLIPFIY